MSCLTWSVLCLSPLMLRVITAGPNLDAPAHSKESCSGRCVDIPPRYHTRRSPLQGETPLHHEKPKDSAPRTTPECTSVIEQKHLATSSKTPETTSRCPWKEKRMKKFHDQLLCPQPTYLAEIYIPAEKQAINLGKVQQGK